MRTAPGTQYHSPRQALAGSVRQLVERCAYQYGKTYDAYLAIDPDRHHFQGRDGNGLVSFVKLGPYVHVIGGLLAPPHRLAPLIRDFLEFARLNRLHPSVFNVVEEDVPAYEEAGFQITKIGEEPIIPVDRCTWQGKAFEWVRRQENFCLRAGLVTREIDPRAEPEHYRDVIVPQLAEINQAYLKSTIYRRELRAFVGRFRPLNLERRRLFIAEDSAGVQAFIICNPYDGGESWAIEMYRSRADATRGVIPFMTLQIARQMSQEGIKGLSLSLLPCLRCETPRPGDSAMLRTCSNLSWNYFTRVFNFQGLYHFKSRFRPEFRSTYTAAYPRVTFCSMYSSMHLWGIYRPHPLALPAHAWRRIRDSWTHHLAKPDTGAAIELPGPHTAPSRKSATVSRAVSGD